MFSIQSCVVETGRIRPSAVPGQSLPQDSIMSFAVAVLVVPLFAAQEKSSAPSVPASTGILALDHSIALDGVKGRIDHLAIDAKRGLLYVAALGNDTVEVVDLGARARKSSIAGMSEPQGVLFLDGFDVLVVANGTSGNVDVFDGDTQRKLHTLRVGEDADNLRFDADHKLVFVAYGRGAIGIFDPLSWKAAGKIDVAAHPEAFVLDAQGERVFANLPSERRIAVLDRATQKLVASWPVESAQDNFPMAQVPGAKRLLVGCRKPPKLLEVDTETGKEIAALDLSGDVDDLAWDDERGRVYASCGEGFVDVFERKNEKLAPAGKIATRRGARTSLFAPKAKRLLVAVPAQGDAPAEIRVFKVAP
jgi:DNA-binding beta-propeller fold protein YncE